MKIIDSLFVRVQMCACVSKKFKNEENLFNVLASQRLTSSMFFITCFMVNVNLFYFVCLQMDLC